MKLIFVLTQKNKSGQISFGASKTVDVGDDNEIKNIASEIAHFSHDVQKLVERNKELGYRTAYNGIKKSLPLSIDIKAVNTEDEDFNVSLHYRNFGKYITETTTENLQAFLVANIEFQQIHSAAQTF